MYKEILTEISILRVGKFNRGVEYLQKNEIGECF